MAYNLPLKKLLLCYLILELSSVVAESSGKVDGVVVQFIRSGQVLSNSLCEVMPPLSYHISQAVEGILQISEGVCCCLPLHHCCGRYLQNMYFLTPWFLKPRGSMPHSQVLFNNSYPEPNQPNSSY